MKHFIIPICLLINACVAVGTTNTTQAPVANGISVRQSTVVEPVAPVRPNASSLNLSVVGQADPQLTGDTLRQLVSGKTVYSQKLDNPSETQIGNFDQNGSMRVSTGGKTIEGNWEIQGNQLCYLLSGKQFCSSVHRSAYDYGSQPLYYFRRASGEPTVVITGTS